MSKPTIAQKGSYVVEVQEGKKYFWCACGLSQKQPFCDGSHKSTGFSCIPYTAEATKKVYFCGCIHKNKLFWLPQLYKVYRKTPLIYENHHKKVVFGLIRKHTKSIFCPLELRQHKSLFER